MTDVAASSMPLLAAVLVAVAVRPSADDATPVRTALVRAAVVVAGYGVVSTEVLSALGALNRAGLVVVWTAAAVVSLAIVWRRRTEPFVWPGRAATPLLVTLGAGVSALVVLELVVALVAEPNNWDSQTYHLARVEHWASQGSVDPYPTHMLPQFLAPPGAEYLVLHLRVLGNADRLVNLVQWAAAVGCVIVASRVAHQLGASKTGQGITAVTVATCPLVVLQATSTQNDVVAALWCVVTVSFALEHRARRDLVSLGFVSAAVGLAVVTKLTAAGAIAPLVAWLLLSVGGPWRPHPRLAAARAAWCAGAIGLGVVVIAGPHFARVAAEFGHPLGPGDFRTKYAMERHDPPAVAVNALRMGQTLLRTQYAGVNDWMADRVLGIAGTLDVDPQDPAITFGNGGLRFPYENTDVDEDSGGFPLHFSVVVLASATAISSRRTASSARAVAAGTLLGFLLLSAMVKWLPFSPRFFLTIFVMGAALVGLMSERAWPAVQRPFRVFVALSFGALLATGTLLGSAALLDHGGRPVRGPASVFRRDPWSTRFHGQPANAQVYIDVAAAVRAAGAQRVGLVLSSDDWEYPWWLLLDDLDLESARSALPDHPASPVEDFDAIVCAQRREGCGRFVPPGWRAEGTEHVLAAFPPDG